MRCYTASELKTWNDRPQQFIPDVSSKIEKRDSVVFSNCRKFATILKTEIEKQMRIHVRCRQVRAYFAGLFLRVIARFELETFVPPPTCLSFIVALTCSCARWLDFVRSFASCVKLNVCLVQLASRLICFDLLRGKGINVVGLCLERGRRH